MKYMRDIHALNEISTNIIPARETRDKESQRIGKKKKLAA